jgi:hypothetical protein
MGLADYIGIGRQGKNDELRAQVAELTDGLRKARVQMSILEGQKDTDPTSSDGSYTTRDALITGVSRKYAASEKWGSELVQRLVKIRSAFVMSGGVDARPVDEADVDSPEMEFIQDFIKANDLDGAFAQALGDEKVIEGQILESLDWVEDPESDWLGYARINYYSYYSTRYEVAYIDGSPARGMLKATFTDSDGNEQTISNDFATLMKFNARINDFYGISDFGGILHVIDNLSKGLEQWFAMNWLFAHPTPFFKTESMQDGKDLTDHLVDTTWKLGDFMAGPADMDLKSGAGDSGSIKEKLTMDARIITAKLGVPIQFMGFPDLMSNRATAVNTMEPVEAVSLAEQKVWKTGFQDMFDKAIALYNSRVPLGDRFLTPGLIEPALPFITANQLKMLIDLYLPAWIDGALSLETLLAKIPDIKAREELERLAAEKEATREEEIERGAEIEARLDRFRAPGGGLEDDEGENGEG